MCYYALTKEEIIRIHDAILNEEPGLPGISRDKSLEGAVYRVQHHKDYNDVDDIFEIAAIYGVALAQGHVFNDGNKRTSLMSMYTFLKVNGYTINAEEEKAKDVIMQIAKKEISLRELANWLKLNTHIADP